VESLVDHDRTRDHDRHCHTRFDCCSFHCRPCSTPEPSGNSLADVWFLSTDTTAVCSQSAAYLIAMGGPSRRPQQIYNLHPNGVPERSTASENASRI